jgi:hypothetical protein
MSQWGGRKNETRRRTEEEFMKFARTLALAGAAALALMGTAAVAQQAPKFEIDTSWPKPLWASTPCTKRATMSLPPSDTPTW